MENKTLVLCVVLVVVAIVIGAAAAAANTPATSYINHTVGGDAGWFFNTTSMKSSSNFSAWVANQNFNLGDYLIFNTNTNQTVIQTYNVTTYENCTMDYASDNDTFQYDGGSSDFGKPLTVAVPLTIVGQQYYFSDADDGFQCEHGMAFGIEVGQGLGLPPSLNQPPPPPYVSPPSPVEEGQDTPTTIISSPPNHGMRMVVHFPWTALMVGLVLYLYVERA